MPVPNQRAAGQKQVIVTMKRDFLSIIDENLTEMGFPDRASFIRKAVSEKLERSGKGVTKELITPPSRAGKGGRPRKITPMSAADLRVAEEPGEPLPETGPRKEVTYPAKNSPKPKKKP